MVPLVMPAFRHRISTRTYGCIATLIAVLVLGCHPSRSSPPPQQQGSSARRDASELGDVDAVVDPSGKTGPAQTYAESLRAVRAQRSDARLRDFGPAAEADMMIGARRHGVFAPETPTQQRIAACLDLVSEPFLGPHISADHSVIVVAVIDEDGMAGQANLAVRFIETTHSQVLFELPIMSVDDLLDGSVELICKRADNFLKVVRGQRFAALVRLEDSYQATPSTATLDLVWDERLGTAELRIRIPQQGLKLDYPAAETAVTGDCDGSLHSIDGWLATTARLVLVSQVYMVDTHACSNVYVHRVVGLE